MQPKLITSFASLTEGGFVLRAEAIGTSLDGNTFFPLPWPTQVPAPPLIKTRVSAYQLLYTEAQGGDRAKIKLRQAGRVSLTSDFKKVASFLEIAADDDVSMLASTGYELRRDIVRSAVLDPLSSMTDLKLTRGALSGVLLFHARALSRADVYNVQLASADPGMETNWVDQGTHRHCNRIEFTGLTPNKVYYARIRPFNKNGYGVWTTSPGLLVL